MSDAATLPPIVYVMGATGTGKSKLAIDVARWLRDERGAKVEIINADAMQVYTALPIATNNVTSDEAAGIPHHLLACLDPLALPVPKEKSAEDGTINVVSFTAQATELIRDMRARGVVPVVVGGTNYYIQSLMFMDNLVDTKTDAATTTTTTTTAKEEASPPTPALPAGVVPPDYDASTPQELHAFLKHIDPEMAEKYHPNDGRRVRRSIEVFFSEGRRHSEIAAEQKQETLRFPPSGGNVVFWVDMARDALNRRLDSRVDDMVRRGVVEEVRGFWQRYAAKFSLPADKIDEACPTRGVFGSIGFKEILKGACATGDGAEAALAEGIATMKSNTRRYAKQQSQWIRNRFCNRPSISVFRFDASSDYAGRVAKPATEILDAAMQGRDPRTTHAEYLAVAAPAQKHKQFTCPVCPNKTLTNDHERAAHLRSRRHKELAAEQRRAEKRKAGGEEPPPSSTPGTTPASDPPPKRPRVEGGEA